MNPNTIPHMIMLDIETTGVDFKKDDIIQIAGVDMQLRTVPDTGLKLWRSGGHFEMKLHTDKKPTSAFAKKHMKSLYKICHCVPKRTSSKVRVELMRSLLNLWPWYKEPIQFAGWNAGIFDVTFLREKKYLLPSGYRIVKGHEELTGDYHYRVYGIEGMFQGIMDAHGVTKEQLEGKLKEMPATIDFDLVAGKKGHDALYDCYDQIDVLNKLIQLTRLGIERTTFPVI